MAWTLVTGGALGLGAEVCLALAKTGRSIAVHYRSSEQEALLLQKRLERLDVAAGTIYGDLSTIESTREFLQRYCDTFEETEAVINNVGNYLLGPASSTAAEQLSALFQSNTIAPLMIIQALLPALKARRGHIVNIGMAGAANATSHAAAYDVTKVSLFQLTKSLAKELAPHGVCVNMVSPGYLENSVDLPSEMSRIPAGRPGRLQEIADAVVFLLSGDYITGQNLEVAGGVRL